MSTNEPTKLSFVQGDSVTYPVTMREHGSQNPVDLTGATFECPIKAEYSGSVIANLTATLTDAANGQFDLTLSSTDSDNLPITKYSRKSFVFEVKMTLSGVTSTPIFGYLMVQRGVGA